MKGATNFVRISRLARVAGLPGFRLDAAEPTFPNGFYRLRYSTGEGPPSTRRTGCVLQVREFGKFAQYVNEALSLVASVKERGSL